MHLELGQWIALRRVRRGGIVQCGDGVFVDRGRSVPDYVSGSLLALLARGHIILGARQEYTGYLPLGLTNEGRFRCDALTRRYYQRLQERRPNVSRCPAGNQLRPGRDQPQRLLGDLDVGRLARVALIA